jgi:hypothetical protein
VTSTTVVTVTSFPPEAVLTKSEMLCEVEMEDWLAEEDWAVMESLAGVEEDWAVDWLVDWGVEVDTGEVGGEELDAEEAEELLDELRAGQAIDCSCFKILWGTHEPA